MSTRTSPTSRTSPNTTPGHHHHHHHSSPNTRDALRVINSSPLAERGTSPGPYASPTTTTATSSAAVSMSGISSSLSSSGGHRAGVRPHTHAFTDLMRSTRGSPPLGGAAVSGLTTALMHHPTAATYGVVDTAGAGGHVASISIPSSPYHDGSPDVGNGSGHRRASWSRISAPPSPQLIGTGSAPPASPGWPSSAASRDRHLAEVDDDELFALDAGNSHQIPSSPAERDGAHIMLTHQMRRLRVNPESPQQSDWEYATPDASPSVYDRHERHAHGHSHIGLNGIRRITPPLTPTSPATPPMHHRSHQVDGDLTASGNGMMRSGSNEHLSMHVVTRGSPATPSRTININPNNGATGAGSGHLYGMAFPTGPGSNDRLHGSANSSMNGDGIMFDGLDRSTGSPSTSLRGSHNSSGSSGSSGSGGHGHYRGGHGGRGHQRAHSDQGLSPRVSTTRMGVPSFSGGGSNNGSPSTTPTPFHPNNTSASIHSSGSGMPAPSPTYHALASSTGRPGSSRSGRMNAGGPNPNVNPNPAMLVLRRHQRDASPLMVSSTVSSAASSPLRTPNVSTREPSPFTSPANSPRVPVPFNFITSPDTRSSASSLSSYNGSALQSPATFYPSQPVAAAVAAGQVVTMSNGNGDIAIFSRQVAQTRASLVSAASIGTTTTVSISGVPHKPQASRGRPPPMHFMSSHATAATPISGGGPPVATVATIGHRGSGSRPPPPVPNQWTASSSSSSSIPVVGATPSSSSSFSSLPVSSYQPPSALSPTTTDNAPSAMSRASLPPKTFSFPQQ